MKPRCPVCWQPVNANVGGHNVDRHHNSIGRPCLEGRGLPIRICHQEQW